MEPEDSLPHSQEPATCPYPEPARSSPYPHIPLPEDPSYYYPPIYAWVPFPSGFHTKILYTSLLYPIRATCPAHLILLDFITRTVLDEEYSSLSSSLCNFLHSFVTLSPLGPNILLNTLFSNTLSLRSFLNVSDQVSHPYKTTGKIIGLCIVIFGSFWITNWKTKDSAPNDDRHLLTMQTIISNIYDVKQWRL